jgi:SAM-dependent methyltransferase
MRRAVPRYLLDRARRALSRQDPLLREQWGQLEWWRQELDRIVLWYEGRRPYYGLPFPEPDDRQEIGDKRRAAAIALSLAAGPERYLHDLQLPPNAFGGKRVLEVGCGPIPYALAFSGCEIWGLDPLIDEYRALGYPLDDYPGVERLRWVRGMAEDMPFGSNSFDAVISVNALDQVHDLPRVVHGIHRVLQPGGSFRMQVYYHPPRELQRWSLDDGTVREHFRVLGAQKVAELPCDRPGERFAIWSGRG